MGSTRGCEKRNYHEGIRCLQKSPRMTKNEVLVAIATELQSHTKYRPILSDIDDPVLANPWNCELVLSPCLNTILPPWGQRWILPWQPGIKYWSQRRAERVRIAPKKAHIVSDRRRFFQRTSGWSNSRGSKKTSARWATIIWPLFLLIYSENFEISTNSSLGQFN